MCVIYIIQRINKQKFWSVVNLVSPSLQNDLRKICLCLAATCLDSASFQLFHGFYWCRCISKCCTMYYRDITKSTDIQKSGWGSCTTPWPMHQCQKKTLVKWNFTQYGTFKTKVHPSSHDRCWPTPVNSTAGMLIAREERLSAPITTPWLILGEEGASANLKEVFL